MKKNFLYLSILGIFPLSSCDMNEESQSSASVNVVFSSAKGLETYAYSFYDDLPNYSSVFKQDATSDYSTKNQIGGMEVGAYTTNSSSSWSQGALRSINFFLENNTNPAVGENIRNHYNGIARPSRARFYFNELVSYDEVPWTQKVFNSGEDPDLFSSQDTRDVTIEHIIDDLDYAYNYINEVDVTKNSTTVNKWTAAFLKSRVCLFEATWRKYHATDKLDIVRTGCTKYSPKQLYLLAAEAAKEVIGKGPYKICTGTSYTNGRGFYRQLFIADNAATTEVMLVIATDKVLQMGEQNWWFNSSTYGPHLCMSRKLVKTYLNRDGSPYRETKNDDNFKTFVEETTNRDLRLNQIVRGYDFTRMDPTGNYVPTAANFSGRSLTGY